MSVIGIAKGSLLSLLERLEPRWSLRHGRYDITVFGAVVEGRVIGRFVVQYDAYYPPPCYGAGSITELLMVLGELRALSQEWELFAPEA